MAPAVRGRISMFGPHDDAAAVRANGPAGLARATMVRSSARTDHQA